MKESEKVDKNVNAREIIANVLKELGMNAPSFATATGIAYQRIFDLQRGRTKKFNPEHDLSGVPVYQQNLSLYWRGFGDVIQQTAGS